MMPKLHTDSDMQTRRVQSTGGLRGMLITAMVLILLPGAQAVHALDLLSPFKNMFGKDDSIIIWQAPGQFVKIAEQDWDRKHRKAPRNSHPAAVDPNELAVVLAAIQSWDTEGVSNREMAVFTPEAIRQLSVQLTAALDRAGPNQDVVFAVTGRHDGISGDRTTAGRMFMHEGELNIIFGDVLSPNRKSDDNTSHYTKPHRAGKRMEPLSRSVRVANGPGIAYWQGNGWNRDDWIKIDIARTLAAYRGPPIQVAAQAAPVMSATAPAAVNDDLQQRWQQREELARQRKQMEQSQAGQTATPAQAAQAPAEVRTQPRVQAAPVYSNSATSTASSGMDSLEHRLATLKSLYEKDLITKDEFDSKRREILGEL
jgi:hypothetical protein